MNDTMWKDIVHPTIIPLIQCGFMNQVSDDSVDAVICTSKQQLLEISNLLVTNSCNIPFQKSDRVSVFYSYDPFCSYYVIESNESLCIIKKSKKLEIFKQYENVEKVEIKDAFNIGTPQLHISFIDEFEPIITDFTIKDFSDFFGPMDGFTPHSELALSLSCNLQDMKLRLEKNKLILKEKKKLRGAALHNFTEDIKGQGFFPVKKVLQSTSHAESTEGIKIGVTWQKMYGDNWVIGMSVKTNKNEMSELELVLDWEEYSSYVILVNLNSTEAFSWRKNESIDDDIHFVSSLPSNSCAYLIAVLKKPCFTTSNSIQVSGVLSYCSNGRKLQSVLSPVTLQVQDLLSDHLLPFSKEQELNVESLLSVIVSNQPFYLRICIPYIVELPIAEILTQKLNFTFLSKFDFYYNNCLTNIGLCGVLIRLKSSSPVDIHALLYARDLDQQLLFVNSLNTFLPTGTVFGKLNRSDPSLKTPGNGLDSLKSELKLMCTVMERNVDSENIKIPLSDWETFRQNLHEQECKTDMIFSQLL